MFLKANHIGRYAMVPFIEQAKLYACYHQNPIARYLRAIGIPMMMLSMMILLGFVHIVIIGILNVTLAEIVTIGLLIYYFLLNWRLAFVATPILIFLLWIATLFTDEGPNRFALWAFLVTFALGCVAEFIEYFIEGKRPLGIALFFQTLIAPLFLIAELFFMVGRMQGLKNQVYESEDDSGTA